MFFSQVLRNDAAIVHEKISSLRYFWFLLSDVACEAELRFLYRLIDCGFLSAVPVQERKRHCRGIGIQSQVVTEDFQPTKSSLLRELQRLHLGFQCCPGQCQRF